MPLPDKTESFFLRYVIDSDLFQQVRADSLPRAEHVYLKSHFDLLGERPLGEDSLDLGHHRGVDHASLWANGVHLLSDPGDDGEVLREIRGEYPGDPVGVEILQLGDLCKGGHWLARDGVNVIAHLLHQSCPAEPPGRPPPWPPVCAPSNSPRCHCGG